MAEKDLAEKILEEFNDVFADIVNVLLFNGEQVVDPDELVDQITLSAYKADGKIRELNRDTAKRRKRQRLHIACIGMENQTKEDPYMTIRVLSYDGSEYRWQLLAENEGEPIYPVITLVLYFGYKKHRSKPRSLLDTMDIPDKLKPFVSDYRINLFEIAYLSREQVNMFRSDFRVAADYFVQMRELHEQGKAEEYVPDPKELDHVQSIMQMMKVFTGDDRFEEAYNESLSTGGVKNMCEALDRIEARGRAAGIAAGIAEGKEAGITEGAVQAIERMDLSFEESVKMLADILRVSYEKAAEEFGRYSGKFQ